MKYGVYTELVNEVIKFAHSMKDARPLAIPQGVSVIHNIDEAKRFAFNGVFGEEEYTWADMRQKEMGKIRGKLYKLDSIQKPQGLERMGEEIAEGLRNKIPDAYQNFFEEILVDIRNCAINRVINGESDNFYEKIFCVYKAGGFPCGWKGDYPEKGELIAYFI
ncbi:hypothetical protein [Priestia filamentosa]|uniref:hypothetical protein n=1 Tax=Priestia filamentosa TaxID=1402861 RepID=UPI00397AB209